MKREQKAIGKTYYSWLDFDADITVLVRKLKRHKKKFTSIWGPARGGLPLAVCLSHALGLPLVARPKNTSTLIVDDIADTGKTLNRFAKKDFFIATLFYHTQSLYTPDIWLREKGDRWIIFPWEYSKK